MQVYTYKVKDDEGKLLHGVVDADNVKSARIKLSHSGFYVLSCEPYIIKKKLFYFKERLPLEVLLMFTQRLTSLIEVGIPILQALEILWKQTEDIEMQIVISHIKSKLESGASLSDAIEEFSGRFPIMFRALLSVAETGAGLVPVLKKLVRYLENQRQFIIKIKRASLYPSLVFAFAIIVLVAMLVVVVPTFQKVFDQVQVELPFFTQLIVSISNTMRAPIFWLILTAASVGIFFLYKRLKAIPKFGYKIDSLKLKSPILGSIYYTASISRFVYSLSLLLGVGLPVVRSIVVSKNTTLNKKIERAIEEIEKQIVEGVSLYSSFKKTKTFPVLLVEMIGVGEASGSLVEVLDKVSLQYEEELDYRLNRLLTVLEPVMIIMVGAIVGLILLAIYSPIFSLWKLVSG